MKRIQKSRTRTAQPKSTGRAANSLPEPTALIAFGAHPDDIEFGCGGIVAQETRNGRPVHFVICSRGESASNGTPAQRVVEAEKAARLLGATVEFVDLDGDAQLDVKAAHAIKLAAILRRIRPAIVLAPTLVENQHPDHAKLGRLVRDACRLARYAGLAKLRGKAAHATELLFFYAMSPESEPQNAMPVLIDVSAPEIVEVWNSAMQAHGSQMKTRNYAELQLARARLHGLRASVSYAIPLWPNDPLVFGSLAGFGSSVRRF
jgi:LmbE family N-acetylglucosaminyl deacetylase